LVIYISWEGVLNGYYVIPNDPNKSVGDNAGDTVRDTGT
jgi:hypothetical protein